MSRDAARARSGASRTSLYDEITTQIIAELEAGRVPWVQPWGTALAKCQRRREDASAGRSKNASRRAAERLNAAFQFDR
jgi:antirestriction protein ArdC